MDLQELKSTIEGVEETEAWKANSKIHSVVEGVVEDTNCANPPDVLLQSSLGAAKSTPTPCQPASKKYREYKFTHQFNALFRKSLSSQVRL
jgi:hypothetical protein